MKKWIYYLSLCLSLICLCSCSPQKSSSAANHLTITTTFYPMYFFTKEIAGKQADVIMLNQGNSEIHDYEPSAKDLAQIEKSQLFIYNSQDLETFVPRLLPVLKQDSSVRVIEASQGIRLHTEHEEGKHHNHQHEADPHVWLDPVLAARESRTIYQAICQADPKHKAYYTARFQKLERNLAQLNQRFQQQLTPLKQRHFVTQHAAFYYLAHQYHLEQVPISGIDPELEPSAKELAHIQKFMQVEDIHTIFVEVNANSKVAQSIQKATGAKLSYLSTLESVSSAEQAKGDNYFSLMEENLSHLVQALS